MTTPMIREDIVADRRQKASALAELLNTCGLLSERLQAIRHALAALSDLGAPKHPHLRRDLDALVDDLADFHHRVRIRLDRFKKGLITVSIAGLEKAGKTTFLKSLTGIDTLPTFDERCTAVCCEIHYNPDRSDFDIEFHSETEFMERVIGPTLETIGLGLPEDKRRELTPPATADGFARLRLPTVDAAPPGTTAYKLLCDLKILQDHFADCRSCLGRPPLIGRPLTELGEWVSYRQARKDLDESGPDLGRNRHLARVTAVKTCRIHTRFEGGSAHLRWIDTPGVDDPNRRARDLTLAAIAAETDLLVVASRPGALPSPSESFHHFWDSVSRQPDEIDLLNRMLFVLNCDRRVDPNADNVRIHQTYLMDAGVPRHLFVGPLSATDPADALRLMETVNAHLASHLPAQDDQVIRSFGSRLKTLQAKIRLLYNALSQSHPSDAGLQDMETECFHKWFHWYQDGKNTGFWTDLLSAMDWATREILEDTRIRESEKALNAIFTEEAKQLQTRMPSKDVLETHVVAHRGESPIPGGMRTLSIFFSRLVNRLASEVQEFGPLMQDKLASVLEKAGLGPLLAGKTPEEKLKTLLSGFTAGSTDEAATAVVDILKETLELPRNLKYVIRYELRAAVDFLDPTLWNAREEAWNRLREMVKAGGGDPGKLATFPTYRYPPVTDSREKDQEVLKKIAGNALFAIHTALSNERYLPRRIADDFIRDCRVRLCFSPESEQEWRGLLFRCRGALLSHTLSDIRAQSERIRDFQKALHHLEMILP